MRIDRSIYLCSKYGEIAAPKWRLDMAGNGLVQASGIGWSWPGSHMEIDRGKELQ
jgi:hypothetical protein